MAKLNLLTVKEVEAAKPCKKVIRLFDGGGLYLEIKPSGQRGWRYKFRLHGRERRMSLGPATSITLAKARELRSENEALVKAGIDPVELRKEKAAIVQAEQDAAKLTFSALVWRWSERYHEREGLADNTKTRNERLLRYLESDIGNSPVGLIARKAVLKSISRIQYDNGKESAARCLALLHLFFESMMIEQEDIVRGDPTTGIRKSLGTIEYRPRAGLKDEADIGHMLRCIWSYEGSPITVAAMKVMAYTFLRSSELRFARWSEVDLEAGEWLIPPERMKYRRNPRANDLHHFVPITKQTREILRDMFKLTGESEFLFPSFRPGRSISENTINNALKAMGFDGRHTQHGFRKTAATRLAALGFDTVHVKRQSGRLDGGIEGVYNAYDYKAERRQMMKSWCDYLDQLRKGANVVAIKSKGAA